MIKILAMAASTRSDSYNKKLLNLAVWGARDAGAEVTVLNLEDFIVPLYEDLVEKRDGIPRKIIELKELFIENHGIIFSMPEYNYSLPAAFKNIIDWLTRTDTFEKSSHCFQYKVCALLSASSEFHGGIRGLAHLRSILENLNTIVMPEQICVSDAENAFDEYGLLKNEIYKKSVEKIGANLVDLTLRVRGYGD
jgi:NAD(P)H-dependent FMN reductase